MFLHNSAEAQHPEEQVSRRTLVFSKVMFIKHETDNSADRES